ncbi:flippase [archaeon]|jgi:O-antigen/teichoic acid export membrane protein|nr:flippase [archaeon]
MKQKLNKKEKTTLNNSLKLIAKSSFILFLFIIFSKIITLLYRIVISGISPEVYGLFSLAVMVSGWIIAFASLGLLGGVIRYAAYYRGKKEINKINYLIKISLTASLISSILGGILLFILAEFISIQIFNKPDLIIYLKGFSLVIPLTILSGIFLSIIQAFEKVKTYSFLRNVLDNSIKLLVLIILITIGLKTKAVIISYISGMLIVSIIAFYICKHKIPALFQKHKLDKKTKNKIKKELLSYSWPLIFTGLVAFIFSWLDLFAIGYFIEDVAQAGIYSAAVPLAALMAIAPSLFIQLFFPLITKEFAKRDNKVIREMSKQIGKWILIINLPFLILILLFPGAIINLFFKPEYLAASQSLRFLAIGMFFYSIFIVSENLLSMAGKSKIVLSNIIIASILNLILNFLLVPKYGINGAAFATMMTYILWSFLSLAQAHNKTKIIPVKTKMLIILIISTIPTIILFYTKKIIPPNSITLALQTSLFLLIYILLIFTTKSLDKNDLMVLTAIKNKVKEKI